MAERDQDFIWESLQINLDPVAAFEVQLLRRSRERVQI